MSFFNDVQTYISAFNENKGNFDVLNSTIIDTSILNAGTAIIDNHNVNNLSVDNILGLTNPGQLDILTHTFTTSTMGFLALIDQDVSIGSTPSFAGLTLTTPLGVGDGGTGQSSYTDGQLLIGNTGNTLAKATLTGTANQITVTNGNGSITLTTPQDIATTSAVNFGSVNGLEIFLENSGGNLRRLLMTDNNPTIATGVDDVMAIGVGALASLASTGNSGRGCVAVGPEALGSLTTGTLCTAVGVRALNSITTDSGFTSTGIGYQAGFNNTRRGDFIGYVAGSCQTTSTLNTFIGQQCGQFGTYSSGGSSVFIGALSVFNTLTSASNCVVIGKSAGNNLEDAVGTTLIGNGANVSGAGIDGSIAIGDGATVGASNRITLGGSGATSMEYAGTNFNTDGIVVSSTHLISSSTTVTPAITFTGGILTNTIGERGAGSGVTIDTNTLIKDGVITSLELISPSGSDLTLKGGGAGNVLIDDSLLVSIILENSVDTGITLDLLTLIKDGTLDTPALIADTLTAKTTDGNLTLAGNGTGEVVSSNPMTIDTNTDIRNGIITTFQVNGANNDDLTLASGAGGSNFIILDDITKVDELREKSSGVGITLDTAVLIKDGAIQLTEASASPITAISTKATIWTRDDTNQTPVFTDESSNNYPLLPNWGSMFVNSTAGTNFTFTATSEFQALILTGMALGETRGTTLAFQAGLKVAITSVTDLGGVAQFNFASGTFAVGEVISLNGFTNYTNDIYTISRVTGTVIELSQGVTEVTFNVNDTGDLSRGDNVTLANKSRQAINVSLSLDVPGANRQLQGKVYCNETACDAFFIRDFGASASIGSMSMAVTIDALDGDIITIVLQDNFADTVSVHSVSMLVT